MKLPEVWFLTAIAARTAIVLIVLVLAIRIFGKRGLGGMNVLDLVLVLMLGNAIQNAITSGSGLLGVGLVSATTLLVLDQVVGGLFVRRPWLERRLFGDPTILYSQGKLDIAAMRQEGIDEDELITAIHAQGLSSLDQCRLAILEEDGTISIIPKDKE